MPSSERERGRESEIQGCVAKNFEARSGIKGWMHGLCVLRHGHATYCCHRCEVTRWLRKRFGGVLIGTYVLGMQILHEALLRLREQRQVLKDQQTKQQRNVLTRHRRLPQASWFNIFAVGVRQVSSQQKLRLLET